MRRVPRRRTRGTPLAIVLAVALLSWCVPAAALHAEGDDERGELFYFLGPRLTPFEHGISGLIAHDMNGDGRTDLILLDNRASKFRLLLQWGEGEKEDAQQEEDEREANELDPDRLLKKDEVRTNQQIIAFTVGAFGGEPAAIAYFTDGKELLVDRQAEGSDRENLQRFLLDLDSTFCGGLERADLNGDGMEDLVFLAQDAVLIFPQDRSGKLREPQHFPVAQERSSGLLLGDVDGDGRPDIVYRAPGTHYPVRVRLTQPDGSPGPEHRFRMPAPRDMTLGDCTGDGRNEIALIESTTNRIKLLRWETQDRTGEEAADAGALEMIPYPKEKKSKTRSFAVADLTGDGLPDVAVTEPGTARVSLIRSRQGVGLLPPESFPALQGAFQIAAMPRPDGRAELLMCSAEEGFLGASQYNPATDRLEYPKPIAVGGTPQAVAVGRGGTDGEPRAYCCVSPPGESDGKEGSLELVTIERAAEGYRVQQRQELPDLEKAPRDLLPVDADGDGRTDLLAFPEYGSPSLLIQGEAGDFTVVSEKPGFHKHMLRDLKAAAMDAVPPRAGEPPAMFLGLGNLIRAVRYDGDNLVVEDQFSSPSGRAAYAALGAADLDGDGVVEVLAADRTSKWLSVLGRDEKGIYRVRRNVEIGPFEFLGLHIADVDGDAVPEAIIIGKDKLGVLALSRAGAELREIAVIETDQEDVRYAQVTICDLNGDGKNELLLREIQEHQLEVLYRTPAGEWKSGMRFKVFEARSFERRERPTTEPREALAAELTGDGLTDVAIIVHDRVIVYPQQGPSE